MEGEDVKDRAIKEIRRRMEAATDKEWVRLKLIRQMIETGSSLDAVGQIVDESGDTWDYAIAFKGILAEAVGDGMPPIRVDRHRGSIELFQRYAKSVNQTLVLSEHEKKLVTHHVIKAACLGRFEN